MATEISFPQELVQSDEANTVKELPSLSNEDLWHFCGERGVYSQSPKHLLSCFDVFYHSKGNLYYRMKLRKNREVIPSTEPDQTSGFFHGVVFHDPMGAFMDRKETKDEVAIMSTHYKFDYNEEFRRGDPIDELENEKTIPYEEFLAFMAKR